MSDFDRIKEKLDLLQTITSETGLIKKGHHLEKCPFCQHQGCFSINEGDGIYHCFSCEAGGDVLTFIESFHQITKAEALKRGAELAGIDLPKYQPKAEPKESARERAFRIAAEHYHQNLMPEGSAGRKWFCETRGHSLTTVSKMRAGWSTGSLLSHLKKHDITETDAVKVGLARDKDKEGNDIEIREYFWKGLAVFPVFDHAGRVLSFTCKDPQKKVRGLQLKGESKKSWFINHPSLGKFQELFVVEGENDVASLIDAGFANVVGTAGQPSDDQIRLIKNFCAGQTVYLWFDRDEQKNFKKETGGPRHIRKLYHALVDSTTKVRVIVHPGKTKDPDEYIQSLFKTGEMATSVHATMREMIRKDAHEPLAWEIEHLAEIDDSRDRLEMFKERELARMINSVPGSAEKELYIDQAAKVIGISVRAVEELVTNSEDLYKDLEKQFGSSEGIRKAEPYRLAHHIYNWFNNGADARFFKTRDKKVYLFHNRRVYEIGNNIDFNTLMLQLTRLAAIERPGTTVWYFLQTLCHQYGEMVDLMSWLYTDRETDIIYCNLSSEHNKIVRIAPGKEPNMIDNGTNEQSVLLATSPQIRPFEYKPNTGEAEGFTRLKSLIMDTTPAEGPQRYFLLCWTISIFAMNYQTDQGLLQVIAGSQVGKSKVAERVSQLIYGESYVGKGTGAAETRVATSNPILFLDNLENRNLTQGTVDLMLFLANSAHKPKAKAGSDTDVLYQKLNAMAMITSIEAFPGRLPELINRTWPLLLEKRFQTPGYMHAEIMRAIGKHRNSMLSAVFKVLGRHVLPRLERRVFWSQYLQSTHPGHNKERNNEHLCTMMIILEAVLKYLPIAKDVPIEKQASELLDKWISYQEEQAQQTAITSNTLLVLMDGLAKEVVIKMRGREGLAYQVHPDFTKHPALGPVTVKMYEDPEYLETFYLTESKDELSDDAELWSEKYQRLEFIITASELYTLLNRYCANQHVRNPYDSPNALGARIRDDKPVMYSAGWQYVGRKEGSDQYKKVGGNRYWRFSKKIQAIE